MASERKRLPVFGAVTVLFWASFLFSLPPIQLTPGLKELASEVREARNIAPEYDRPQEEIEAGLIRSLRKEFTTSLIFIVVGTVSGVLIWRRRRLGAILAIGLCSLMLVLRVVSWAWSYPHILERLHVLFTIFLPRYPFHVIHNDIIGTFFFIGSIAFLTRRGAWREYFVP